MADWPTIADVSGNGYDGTATNMEETDVVVDSPGGTFSRKSLLFDGSEYVTMGNVFAFDRTDSFSISFWIKYTSLDQWVVTKEESGGHGYAVGINSVGHIRFQMVNVWTTDWMQVRTAGNFNDGAWHHVAITHDSAIGGGGKAASCHIYVDNVDQSLTVNADLLTSSIVGTGPFALAAQVPASLYFAGNLDEVAIYSDVLSAGEVTWIYNSGVPRDLLDGAAPTNLEGWWRMGDEVSWPFAEVPIVLQQEFPQDIPGLTKALPVFGTAIISYLMRGINGGGNYVYWQVAENPDLTAIYAPEPIPDLSTVTIAAQWI